MELLGLLVLLGIFAMARWALAKPRLAEENTEPDMSLAPQEVLYAILNGDLRPLDPSSLVPRPGERVLVNFERVRLGEEARRGVGAYAGASVRVSSGVSARGGVFEGESVRYLEGIEDGNLVLTNQRLVFAGVRQIRETPLERISWLTPADSGFALGRKGKSKMEVYLLLEMPFQSRMVRTSHDPTSIPVPEEVRLSGMDIKVLILTLLEIPEGFRGVGRPLGNHPSEPEWTASADAVASPCPESLEWRLRCDPRVQRLLSHSAWRPAAEAAIAFLVHEKPCPSPGWEKSGTWSQVRAVYEELTATPPLDQTTWEAASS